ncbi:MAG: hypothetical protein AN483_12825 [Aphanizomenon flos-aquae MDT14a]|jgi:hypothetical protein|uniref:Uncharacterized protein n=1 Tax=Aphanizomenon flos-aquae WA102 TaxID=1710896 RepID=A0A1B7X2Q1_APHFL|nr:MAG: hypothetical protein AN483_12825 [Aphanizomenon flos-aquae MDT14a]OBQ43622.1 MAG: hypothetical protein AN484_11505 [Aphanizomenon flos-aquae WA102]
MVRCVIIFAAPIYYLKTLDANIKRFFVFTTKYKYNIDAILMFLLTILLQYVTVVVENKNKNKHKKNTKK